MRIAYFVPRCTPDNSHGRYVVELARRLSRDHEITVYSSALWPPLRTAVRYRFVPVPIRPVVGRLLVLWSAAAVAARGRRWDIVHVQGADAPVGNVVTAHFCNGVLPEPLRRHASLRRRFNHRLGAMVERYCFARRGLPRIIAVSRQLKADLEREYGIEPSRVAVVYHGVDTETFHPSHRARYRETVRAHLHVRPTDFVVLFVGGDYQRKGLLPLLTAAGSVGRAVRVMAVGVRVDSRLRQALSRPGSGPVTFVDHSTDIAQLYAAADCFALPTQYDTFSLAALEAMASGLPVVVTRAAGVSELLTSGRDCLIVENPANIEELARSIQRIQEDETLRTSLAGEARRTAERYSWDQVARRTLDVYGEALSGGDGGSDSS